MFKRKKEEEVSRIQMQGLDEEEDDDEEYDDEDEDDEDDDIEEEVIRPRKKKKKKKKTRQEEHIAPKNPLSEDEIFVLAYDHIVKASEYLVLYRKHQIAKQQ